MLKRLVSLAALALVVVLALCCTASNSAAQSSSDGSGGHALAPGDMEGAAPAKSAGGAGQVVTVRWIAWSWLSTRWMLAGQPAFSPFASYRLAAWTRRVW